MIHLYEDYYCRVDSVGNYTLQIDTHKTDKEGNPIYKSIGFHRSLKNCILFGLKRQFDAKTLSELDCSLQDAIKVITENDILVKNILEEKIKE